MALRYCPSLANGKQICLWPMGGSPVPPAVLDDALHSMEESGEPSPLFFGTHSTNHKIRWNQGNSKALLGSSRRSRLPQLPPPPAPGRWRVTRCASLSVSRLWQQHGQRQAVYALLAPVCGWFTEGFDMADLQEAETLLEAGAAGCTRSTPP